MGYLRSKRSRDIAGSIAAAILALACLVAAAYHIKVLGDLDQRGVEASAVVVEIERGARNSSFAVYHYRTASGEEVTSRDLFQQYIKRVNKGDSLTVIYDSNEVSRVTADLGPWNWQAPAIFLCGFVFLAVLALLIWRHRNT